MRRKASARSQGMKSRDLRRAARGIDQTGEHFQGGRFSRAVGSEKRDHFPGFDRETDVIDRFHRAMFSFVKSSQGSKQSLAL